MRAAARGRYPMPKGEAMSRQELEQPDSGFRPVSSAAAEPIARLSPEELATEGGELLPDKEVLSILDLFVNLDIALDLAAPIDLAVAANANVAAPIDAAASANVLSFGSTAGALAHQATLIDQHISGDAIANAPQDASLDQSNGVVDAGGTAASAGGEAGAAQTTTGDLGGTVQDTTGDLGGTVQDAAGSATDGPLLNVNVDASLDADVAAPIDGAVAANANVAAPIDAAVSANIGSADSSATAIADQTAIINQDLDGVTADATAAQNADLTQ